MALSPDFKNSIIARKWGMKTYHIKSKIRNCNKLRLISHHKNPRKKITRDAFTINFPKFSFLKKLDDRVKKFLFILSTTTHEVLPATADAGRQAVCDASHPASHASVAVSFDIIRNGVNSTSCAHSRIDYPKHPQTLRSGFAFEKRRKHARISEI